MRTVEISCTSTLPPHTNKTSDQSGLSLQEGRRQAGITQPSSASLSTTPAFSHLNQHNFSSLFIFCKMREAKSGIFPSSSMQFKCHLNIFFFFKLNISNYEVHEKAWSTSTSRGKNTFLYTKTSLL